MNKDHEILLFLLIYLFFSPPYTSMFRTSNKTTVYSFT